MKKSELDLTYLKNSLATLKECYSDYLIEENPKIKVYIKDSCVQRYEYTYETAKKVMNKFLKKEFDKQEIDLTINNIFRSMFGLGIIENFDNWCEYREKRNSTSHEYDNTLTFPILEIIPKFINDVDILISNLEKTLIDD